MEGGQYDIECGRCGEVGVGVLTAEEARAVSDCTGPAYRQCGRCGKMTGWIAARSRGAVAEEARQTPIRATGRADENVVPSGQERMATQTERDEVDAMLAQT